MRTYASQMDREVGDFSNANTFLRQSTAGTYPEWNGSFGYPECPDERATANNPLYKLARNDGFKRYNRFNTTLFSKVKFFKDLSWDFNFNYPVTETCLISRYPPLTGFVDVTVVIEIEIPA